MSSIRQKVQVGRECASCFWVQETMCLHRNAYGDSRHSLKSLREVGGMCGVEGKYFITEAAATKPVNAFEIDTPPCGDDAFGIDTPPCGDDAFKIDMSGASAINNNAFLV